jgi:TfoX/Sxy family transcriptional regulator of competence genes
MSFNEKMADRVREMIAAAETNVEEKRMFGGLCFMVNDKMCVGIKAASIMVRIDPVMTEEAEGKEGAERMILKGRELKGYFFVDEEVLRSKKQLAWWVDLALDFNKFAKSSKKKK